MNLELAREILHRLPLAEATLQVWRWIFDAQALGECFAAQRGRCYERVISFETMVHLMADALINHQGNAKRCFEEAIAAGTLNTSVQAAYGKLRRMPIEVSEALVNHTAERLHDLWPAGEGEGAGMPSSCPSSFDHFEPYAIDGKTIKRVARRLKPLRGVKAGLLGGRITTALSLRQGLIEAIKADPDGHAAEVNLVPALVDELRRRAPSKRYLWVCDRGFCTQNLIELLGRNHDAFVVRLPKRLRYTQDQTVPASSGVDAEGRTYEESWGWVGTVAKPQRFRIRRVKLELAEIAAGSAAPPADSVIVITNLSDADQYPAVDLLEIYRQRWKIERVFQSVTEVFGLRHLIGSSPQATIFQFAFCAILYNVIQLHRAFIAEDQARAVSTISTEKYFQDVRDDLIACTLLIDPADLPALLPVLETAALTQRVLRQLHHDRWKPRWAKAPPPNRRRPPKVRTGPQPDEGYGQNRSVYRILEQARRAPC